MKDRMEKTTLFYDSGDGVSKIHAVIWMPDAKAAAGGKPRAVLQVIHGMAEYAERYEKLAEYLTAAGFAVAGEDHLGHGKTVPADGTFGYFCEDDPATVVVDDVHRLTEMIKKQYPGVPYFILGHSMGSFILRNYMAKYGADIQGAVIMGTGNTPKAGLLYARFVTALQKLFTGGKHKSGFLDWMAFGGFNKRIPDCKTKFDWLSRNEENVAAYEADALCGFTFTVNGFETLFELIRRAESPKYIANTLVSLPVLLQSGTDDPVGGYAKGVEAVRDAYLRAGLTDVECILYAGDRHEILNEADGDRVMNDLYHWIMSRIAKIEKES